MLPSGLAIQRLVEDIEHLGPELSLTCFRNMNVFGKRHIGLPSPRSSQEVARDIAEPGGADTTWVKRVCAPGNAKGAGIDIPAGQIQRLAGNEDWGADCRYCHPVPWRFAVRFTGNPVRADENRAERPRAEHGPQYSRLVQIRFAGTKRKLIDGIRVHYVAGVKGAAGALPAASRSRRQAGNILRRHGVAVAAAVRIVVDLVRPRVVGGDQEPTSEGAL